MIRPLCLAIISCSLFAAPVCAQDFLNRFDHFTAEVGAGFSFPAGVHADHLKTGFNFVASGGPRFNSHFTLTGDFSLHYLNVKRAEQIIDNNAPQVSLGSMMRMWSLTLNPGYTPIKQERFSLYLTAGYGLYNRRLLLAAPGPIQIDVCDEFWDVCMKSGPFTKDSVTGNLSIYKGGYNAGGGVTFGSRTKFFIETRYHHMFTPKAATQVVPITFGIRW